MPVRGEAAVEIAQQFLSGRIGRRRFDAQEVIDLADEDDQGDARGEAGDDRLRG